MAFASRYRSARARFRSPKTRGGMLAKSTLMSAGVPTAVGAVAQIVTQMANEKVTMIGSRWYGAPIALLVLAILMHRRTNMSMALAGAAGYAGLFNYKLNKYQQGQGPVPFGQFTATAGSGGTKALPEGYAGALHTPGVDFAVVG